MCNSRLTQRRVCGHLNRRKSVCGLVNTGLSVYSHVYHGHNSASMLVMPMLHNGMVWTHPALFPFGPQAIKVPLRTMSSCRTLMCILYVSLLAVYVLADAGKQPFWQSGVLCRGTNNRIRSCTTNDNIVVYNKFKDSLAGSSSWPAVISTSSSSSSSSSFSKAAAGDASRPAPRFVVLSRLLQPKEANVQFAQAFCVSIGGRLAYWNSPKEYDMLTSLVRSFAAKQRSPVYAYVGAVQLPGSKRAQDGWVWLHKPARVSQAFPWAAGEPNDHNEGKAQGHTEDCAVLATYHKASEKNITDDFPCNYATAAGKFMFNGHNPHLTVACRLGPVQNL